MELARPRVLKLLAVMSALYDRSPSEEAARLLAEDLGVYPELFVVEALSRCRRELSRFPNLAEIIERLPDGRPGVEEAWSMLPKDESSSVVWTSEMAEAFGIIRGQIEDDEIAARMAFKEIYTKLLREARSTGRSTEWTVSLGHYPPGREAALVEALIKNRISPSIAQSVLGYVPALPVPKQIMIA